MCCLIMSTRKINLEALKYQLSEAAVCCRATFPEANNGEKNPPSANTITNSPFASPHQLLPRPANAVEG